MQLSEIYDLQVICNRNPFHRGFALLLEQCPLKYQTVNYLLIFQSNDQYKKRDSSLADVGTNLSQKGYSTETQCLVGAAWLDTVVLCTEVQKE